MSESDNQPLFPTTMKPLFPTGMKPLFPTTMEPLFYIGCLPRCGSAWLTAAINACTPLRAGHEVMGRYPDDWFLHFNGGVGSDILVPSIVQRAEENGVFNRLSPKAIYYIHRPILEVKESLTKCGVFTPDTFVDQLIWDSDFYEKRVDPRNRFEYSELYRLVRRLAFDLGVWCDEVKLQEMMSLRVTSRRWNDSIPEEE